MLALWDTTGTEVVKRLATERRSAGGLASGLALTLIVVVDDARIRQVENAATIAASAHPCRLLVVSRGPVAGPDPATVNAADRLDAEIIVGGRLGPCEAVVLRMHGRLALHTESVIMPLLAPDVPVVTWWHGPPPASLANDPLGVVAERRITDIGQCADPAAALLRRAQDYAPGDTDLAWTRLTNWRSLIAGAFDTITGIVAEISVTGSADDPATALLRGWLTTRLGVTAKLAPSAILSTDVPSTASHSVGTHGLAMPGPAVSGTAMAESLSGVDFWFTDGSRLTLHHRGDGTAVLTRTGIGDRILPLVRRRLGEEVAEELRRLDPDQPYAAALQAATGITGLGDRPAARSHVWQDPAMMQSPVTA